MFSKKRSDGGAKLNGSSAVGEDLAKVLPHTDLPWWKEPHLLKLNILLLGALFSSATVGYDGAMMNAQLVMPEWRKQFHNPSGGSLGLVNAIFFVGKIAGLPFVTMLSNKIGRRRPILIGILLCLVGAAIQASSVNFGMLVFSRGLLGCATAFMSQPSPMLITEIAYPTHRGKITALYQTFFYFGAILSAWTGFGTVKLTNSWAWRAPCVLQGFFPALQLLWWWFLPESPRWLLARGEVEAARTLLVKHHANGDEMSPLVDFEINEIRETIRVEKEMYADIRLKHLIATPANRKRIMIAISLGFSSQWAGNGVVSYYLTLVLSTIGIGDPTTQSLINGILQIFNFGVSVFIGAMLVDRLGRRVLFLWSAAGMGFSYIVWTALNGVFLSTKNSAVGIAVVPMIFIYYFHYGIAFTPLLYSYPAEIFPYHMRSWGLSLTLFCSYLALIFNLFANPIAMEAISWRYYILYCCLNFVIFTTIYFLYPETKGHSLEEIAKVFEAENAAAAVSREQVLAKNAEHLERIPKMV